jgi:hypothetical protein
MSKIASLIALMFVAGCSGGYAPHQPASTDTDTTTPDNDDAQPTHRQPPTSNNNDAGDAGSGNTAPTSEVCNVDTDCTGHNVCNEHVCQAPSAPRTDNGMPQTNTACQTDNDCPGSQVCNNKTCGNPPDTSGNSGTGGTSSSGSAGSSNNNDGSGNTTSTGGTATGTSNATFTVQVRAKSDFPNFSFSYLSGKTFFSGGSCTSSGSLRTCAFTGSPDLDWDFYTSTGFSGAGSWVPGIDNQTGKCSAFYDVVVTRLSNGGAIQDVGFSLVSDGGSGCHFRIPANAPVIGTALDANADWDNDGVRNADDCEPMNPSVRPKLANESWDNEICGDNVDNNCSGGDLVCGSSSGSSGSSGGNGDLVTETFIAFGADYWATPLQLMAVTGNAGTVSCYKITSTDPEVGGNATYNAVRCDVQNVDRGREFEFQMQTGTKYATGYDANKVCMKNFRIYAYDNGTYPAGHFDSSSSTSAGNGKPMPARLISNSDGCHVILPAR